MPTRDTTVKAVRIPNSVMPRIESSMKRHEMTYNAWLIWAIQERLRKHRKE